MQAKNLLVFIVLCTAILVGWPLLQKQLWPGKPKERPKEDQQQAKKDKKEPTKKPKSRKQPDKVEAKKEAKQKPKPEPEKRPARRTVAGFIPERVTLGQDSDRYHIRAVLTTRGGGVEGVTLIKFDQADADGKDTEHALHLVPPDPAYPSNVLYHFAQPELDRNRRPLDTLGIVPWDIVPGKKGQKVVTDDDGVQEVTFKARVPGYRELTIYKTYRLAPREYHLGLTIEVRDERTKKSKNQAPRWFRYQLTGGHGLPIEGKWYTGTFRNALVGLVDPKGNLWRSVEESRKISTEANGDRVPESGLGDDAIQYAAVVTQYFASAVVVDNTEERKDQPPNFLEWVQPTVEMEEMKGQVLSLDPKARWFDFVDSEHQALHHFEVADDSLFDDLRPNRLVYVSYRPGMEQLTAYEVRPGDQPPKPQLDDITVRVNTRRFELQPGQKVTHQYLLYNGPVKVRLLGQFSGDKAVPEDLVKRYENDLHLNTLTDYHSDNWFGRFASKIQWTNLLILCTNLMHGLLGLLHSVVPVYGLCIILLTVLVRGLMFPISRKQAYLSMKMQELAPELKKLQEKYKADPQAKTQAMMELYRKHGVNPLAGCLPLLLQMPIFLGLYYALQESIFFRLAGFLWIDNLAAPDMLFRWGSDIPLISSILGPYFNLLPVLAVTLMLVQQKMMAPPVTDEAQATQQKIMKIMMIFIGFMFYKVAAGLCLYFIASSLWGVAERKLLPKRKPTGVTPSAEPGGPTKPGARGGGGSSKPKKPTRPPKNGDGTFQKVRNWWADVLKQAKKK